MAYFKKIVHVSQCFLCLFIIFLISIHYTPVLNFLNDKLIRGRHQFHMPPTAYKEYHLFLLGGKMSNSNAIAFNCPSMTIHENTKLSMEQQPWH